MDEGSRNISKKQGLLKEWTMLLKDFLDFDFTPVKTPIKTQITSKVVQTIKPILFKSAARVQSGPKKTLSEKRRRLYQEIEKVKKQLEELDGVLENLHLVGTDDSGVLDRKLELKKMGEKLSLEVSEVEDEIKNLNQTSVAL